MDTGNDSGRDEKLVRISQLIDEYREVFAGRLVPFVDGLYNIVEVLDHANLVFVAGNGGSAATAIHLASDLRDAGVLATSLCENISVVTRLANDTDYAEVFSRQLLEREMGEDDALVLITGSGNSPNILRAAETGQRMGMAVIGLIGFGGGNLKSLCDYDITLESRNYGVVEGVHSCFCHIIPQVIKEIRSGHGKAVND